MPPKFDAVITLFTLYYFSAANLKLSSGREFLVMFMENRVDFPVYPPMEVFVAGRDTEKIPPTNVTVSYPTPDGPREVIHLLVYPKEVHKIEFNHTIMQVVKHPIFRCAVCKLTWLHFKNG